jgi:hypothetical protein
LVIHQAVAPSFALQLQFDANVDAEGEGSPSGPPFTRI